MKKDNKLGKFVAFVLLVTLVALILVANTYAKYTTTKDLDAVATVAKWAIKLGDKDITQNETASFDLFTTVKDTNGSTEEDVSNGKIAPGTQGSFEVKIENASEVTAKYTVTFDSENTSSIPVEFSVDGGNNWNSDISQLKLTGELKAGAKTTDAAPTIPWRWVFERGTEDLEKSTNNTADTALGIATAAPTVKVTAHLVAEQLD